MMNYGMFSEYGNKVVDGVVIAAKQIGWTAAEVCGVLRQISEVPDLAEAGDTEVRERVYAAIFKEAA